MACAGEERFGSKFDEHSLLFFTIFYYFLLLLSLLFFFFETALGYQEALIFTKQVLVRYPATRHQWQIHSEAVCGVLIMER